MRILVTLLSAVSLVFATAAPAQAQLGGPGAKDIMFAIDTTGSMDPYIAQTKIAAENLAGRLTAADGRSRVGLVEYRDLTSDSGFQSRPVVGLTSDFARFRSGLHGLRTGGGGDDPESVYSGIARALCSDWAPDRTRAIIVIGDQPAKDPEPGTGLTGAAVSALARGASTANPYCSGHDSSRTRVYVISRTSDVVAQLDALARDTGGRAVGVESIDQVAAAIERTVSDIDLADGLAGSLENLPETLALSAALGLSNPLTSDLTTGSLSSVGGGLAGSVGSLDGVEGSAASLEEMPQELTPLITIGLTLGISGAIIAAQQLLPR